jgi:hypothetical protein
MGFNFTTLINILTTPPGDLIYYFVAISVFLLMSMFALLSVREGDNPGAAKHTLIGSSVLLIIHGILLILSRMFPPGTFNISPIFGMIERIIQGLSLTWLIWLFLEVDHKFARLQIMLFVSLTIIFFGITLILLNNLDLGIMPDINQLHQVLWISVLMFVTIIGLIYLTMQRPSYWVIGASILALLAVAYLVHIIQFTPGELGLGAIRLAQTLSYPWVIVLLQRLSNHELQQENKTNVINQNVDESRLDITPILINDLLKLSLIQKPDERLRALIKAISLAARSDICYLLQISDDGEQIKILMGYDLIRETFLEQVSLKNSDLSNIIDAWKRHQSLRLSDADLKTNDAKTVTSLQGYHRLGNLLAYPLGLPEHPLMGGVIFVSPYTDKAFGKDTIRLMDLTCDNLAIIAFSSSPQDRLSAQLETLQGEYLDLTKEKERLTQSLLEKEKLLVVLDEDLKQWKAKYQIEKLDSLQRIENLKAELTRLTAEQSEHESKIATVKQIQSELRQSTAQRDQLQKALAKANDRIDELQLQLGQTGPIRLSMDNRVISLDAIATNAKLELASSIQHKQIDLEIINPGSGSMVKTDPGLLQSVLFHLLDNAIKASEPQSTVQLIQKLSYETGMLIIQVTDFGKGLTTAEQTALFGTEPQQMPGIGSLQSIREAVRAIRVLNGKVWLKSKKDAFTSFRVQIPVRIID